MSYEGNWKEGHRDYNIPNNLSVIGDQWKTIAEDEWSSIPQGQAQQIEWPAESLVCKTDNLKYIERLLILGTGQQNKYKSGISKISLEDLALVQAEIDSPTKCYKLLDLVADIYLKGRAPNQNMTLQVLALICRCKTNVTLRRTGYELVGKLRTLSQLYLFLGFYTGGGTPSAASKASPTKGKKGDKTNKKVSPTIDTISLTTEGATLPATGGSGGGHPPKGFGRAFKTALNRSFLKKTPQALAYQVTKYQSRGDWGFNDIIKCTHLRTGTGENRKRNTKYLPSDYQAPPIKAATPMDLVLRYSMYGMEEMTKLATAFKLNDDPIYEYLWAIHSVKSMTETDTDDLIHLVHKYRLVREHLPTWSMKSCAVQKALLFGDPCRAYDCSFTQLGITH